MKKLLAFLLILSLLSLTSCSTKTEAQQLTINDIIEQSDGCVFVSTIGYKERMTHEEDNYYTQVILKQNNLNKPPEGDPPGLITIIQKGENYIKKDERYVIFVNRSETEENHFYITGGKSGVIKLEKDYNFERDEYDGIPCDENGYKNIIKYELKYKCLDKNMQESTEKLLGTYYDYDSSLQWLVETGEGYVYYGTELIKGVHKYMAPYPFYQNGTTAEPRTYSDENVITTAPREQS